MVIEELGSFKVTFEGGIYSLSYLGKEISACTEYNGTYGDIYNWVISYRGSLLVVIEDLRKHIEDLKSDLSNLLDMSFEIDEIEGTKIFLSEDQFNEFVSKLEVEEDD